VVRAELTDALVADAATGDQVALGAIYSALAPPVLGYLRARAVEDPEGMTNDVFVKLLPQLPRITGGAEGVRKLAFTIARARVIDAVRSRARAAPQVPYDPRTDTRTVGSAEDAAHSALSLARVQAVLDVLPDDQREVLTLRVVADLTIEQVAEVMGRSTGAVKQLQRRGMIAVRRALAERRVTL
jgi:RNA polymerase sigma factor (sigma-70 family)